MTALTRKGGKVVWQLRTNAIVESSPAVVDGVAYFGATDGRLFAVDADTGHVRWAYDTGGRINSSPSLARGRVCITTYAGSIFCLRQRDGHEALEHVRQARRVPLRELLRERVDRRRAALHDRALGQDRRARRRRRARALDATA